MVSNPDYTSSSYLPADPLINSISDSNILPEDPTITASTAFVVYDPAAKTNANKDEMQQLFTEHSYKCSNADTQSSPLSSKVHPGSVIVLAGTSTAGKSSIVNALKKLDPDIVEEDLDLRNDTQKIPGPNAQSDMMDDVIKHSLQGKKVVVHVDQAYKFLNHMLARKVDLPVKTVLAFCPFHELSRRLIERNRKAEGPGGDPQNLRDPLMPIDNFSNLYTQAKEPSKSLEKITRDQAIKTYNDHFDKMIAYARKLGRDLPPDEVIASDKVESLREFLSNLGFKEGIDSVNIEPRRKEDYHFIFDTQKYGDAVGSATIAQILYDDLMKPKHEENVSIELLNENNQIEEYRFDITTKTKQELDTIVKWFKEQQGKKVVEVYQQANKMWGEDKVSLATQKKPTPLQSPKPSLHKFDKQEAKEPGLPE